MNQKLRISRLLAPLLPLTLAACASAPIDCSDSRTAAAAAGHGNGWLEPAIETADPDCRTEAIDAWIGAAAALDCSTRFAFTAARLNRETDPNCAAPAYVEAARLGAMIGELERERAEIETRLADDALDTTARRDLRQRGITIDRDLPQLEALARFDDLLPPVAVPDRAD